MNKFTKFPDWPSELFTLLCFQQVKDQLSENLMYHHSNSPSFICNGQLFAFTHNRTLIEDESTTAWNPGFYYDHANN